ncbi:MAG: winged helix-turn-helix transcriptional regulator [Candidatus Bathyarchaeota archaeon]
MTPKEEKERTETEILNALRGAEKPLTWSLLLKKVKVSKKTLANRLEELETKKLVIREVDPAAKPPRVTYTATEKARDLPLVKLYRTMRREREEAKGLWHYMEWTDTGLEERAENAVRFAARDFMFDFLFTLKHALKNPDAAPFLISIHAKAYAEAFMSLFEEFPSKDALQTKVDEIFKKLQQSLQDEFREDLAPRVSQFRDGNQPAAEKLIKLYLEECLKGNLSPSFVEFLEQVDSDEELRARAGVDEAQLRSVRKDPGAKTMRLTPFIKIT